MSYINKMQHASHITCGCYLAHPPYITTASSAIMLVLGPRILTKRLLLIWLALLCASWTVILLFRFSSVIWKCVCCRTYGKAPDTSMENPDFCVNTEPLSTQGLPPLLEWRPGDWFYSPAMVSDQKIDAGLAVGSEILPTIVESKENAISSLTWKARF